jgi:hypothetical protein
MVSDAVINLLMIKELQGKGYVITHADDDGIAGVDTENQPIHIKWDMVAHLILTLRLATPTYSVRSNYE